MESGDEDTQSSAAYRVRPLPVTTWTAVWSLVSFCGTFAGVRGWRLSAAVDQQTTPIPPSFALSALISMLLVACVAGSGWLALSSGVNPFYWPIIATMLAGWCGGILGVWVERDPARHERQFQSLGPWSALASQELRVPEFSHWWRGRLFDPLVRLAGVIDEWLLSGSDRFSSRFSGWIAQTVEELRNESDVFYAVSLVTTVGSLIVTWWVLAG